MKNGEEPINHVTENEKDRHDQNPNLIYLGLTKREAMAMAAMQGILAASTCVDGFYSPEPAVSARDAVAYADALLKELDKTQE